MKSCWRNVGGVGALATRAFTPEGRELLLRMTTGDLMDEFQAGLDADLAADPLLSGDTDNSI